jgi:hypothetical protein
MEHRHRVLESLLRGRSARNWEGHPAQLAELVIVLVLL